MERAAACLRDAESCPAEDRLDAFFRTMSCPRPSLANVTVDEAERSAKKRSAKKESCVETRTANATVDQVECMLANEVQLMALSPTLVDLLTEDGLYVPAMIPLRTYDKMKRGVRTIGIPTVLVTNLPAHKADIVSSLLEQVEANKPKIEEQLGGVELDLWDRREPIPGTAVDQHVGAQNHFKWRIPWALWVSGFILGLVIAVAGLDPWWFRRGLAAGWYLLLLTVTLCVILLVWSVAMMQAEGTVNPDFSNPVDSLRHTFSLLSGQPGQRGLMTRQGEVWRWVGLFCFPVVCWLAVVGRHQGPAASSIGPARTSD